VEQGLLGLRFASTKIPGFSRCGFLKPTSYNDAMSITKRYFTSLRNMRSYASLIFWIGITSTSAVSLCDRDSFPRLHAISGMLQSTLQKVPPFLMVTSAGQEHPVRSGRHLPR